MRKHVLIDYYGELLTFAELSNQTKVKRTTLIMRYKNGIRGEDLWKPSTSRSIHSVDYYGKQLTLSELSDITSISYAVLLNRYKKGYRGEELWNPPKIKRGKPSEILVDYYGKQLTLSELSRITGIPHKTLYLRYSKGDTGERLWRPVEIEVDYYGKSVTLRELAKITEIKYNTIFVRYDNGDRGEDLWRPIGQRKQKKKVQHKAVNTRSSRTDITGTVRGKLRVICFDEEKGKWKCKCECGNIAYFTAAEWAKNRPASCGCYKRRKDITGKRYGKLIAVEPTGELDQHGAAYWFCRCDCGNTTVVSLRNLRNNQTKSCGCLKVEQGIKLGTSTRNHCVDGSDPYKLIGTKPRSSGSTGFKGVWFNKKHKKYTAEIMFKNKKHYIGEYDTPEEAHQAYLEKKEELHGEYLEKYKEKYPDEWIKVQESVNK